MTCNMCEPFVIFDIEMVGSYITPNYHTVTHTLKKEEYSV